MKGLSNETLELLREAIKSNGSVNIVIIDSFHGVQTEEEGRFDRVLSWIESRSVKIGLCTVCLFSVVTFVTFKWGYMTTSPHSDVVDSPSSQQPRTGSRITRLPHSPIIENNDVRLKKEEK